MATAFHTIQEGVNRLRPGDRVLVGLGDSFEEVRLPRLAVRSDGFPGRDAAFEAFTRADYRLTGEPTHANLLRGCAGDGTDIGARP